MLDVTVKAAPQLLELALHGAIDGSTVATLDDCLHAAMATGVDVLVVDLDGVTYLDGAGIACIRRAGRQLETTDGSLQLHVRGTTLRRTLVRAGLAAFVEGEVG